MPMILHRRQIFQSAAEARAAARQNMTIPNAGADGIDRDDRVPARPELRILSSTIAGAAGQLRPSMLGSFLVETTEPSTLPESESSRGAIFTNRRGAPPRAALRRQTR
jgi:hypothetical protein